MTKREIFLKAQQARSEQERAQFLQEACRDNAELRTEIENLLSYDWEDDFLEQPPVEVAPDPTVGSSIGPYKVLQVIGEGGMGIVYMAEQRQPIERRVALKIIKLGMDTRQVITRFEAERQALAMMDHPNIARVFDAGSTRTGRPYFVMELVRGFSLTEFCDKNTLTTPERLQLFAQVCRAVHHAHQKGIIHRDIKPSNVLVTLIDGKPVPKVIDFGIAKATNFRLTEKTLFTEFQNFIGTPMYVSPEQMEMSGQNVDTRSDIYSLGVLLYELLTGSTPIERDSVKKAAYAEIQRMVVEVEPPKPSTRVSTLSEERLSTVSKTRSCEPGKLRKLLRGELDWIVMKAIEKDRSRRYESAASFAEDIEHFLALEPVGAARPDMGYRLRKFARRNKGLLTAAGLVFCALLLGTIVSAWEATERALEARRAREAEAEAKAQANRAEAGEFEARRNLYIADMNFAQEAVESGNMERAIQILERHFPVPDQEDMRDFEWRYLWGQTHRELFSLLADDDPADDVKPDPVYDLTLSPLGNLLASASRLGRIRVWDLVVRRELFQFDLGINGYCWVAFSPNGQHLAAAGSHWDRPSPDVVVWDVVQRREVQRLSVAPARSPTNPQFTPDGVLVIGDSDGGIWFWNLETGEKTEMKAHDSGIRTVSIAAKVPRMVTTGRDAIKVWNLAHRSVIKILPNEGDFYFTTITRDGSRLAAAPALIPRVVVFDSQTGESLAELRVTHPSHGGWFSPDGTTLAVTELTGAISVFETQEWRKITTYQHPGHQLNALAFSDDNGMLVSGGDNGQIKAWPGIVDPARGHLQANGWLVTALIYSPDGRILAIGNGNGSVEIWDAVDERLLFATPEQSSRRGVEPDASFEDDFFALSADSDQLALSAESEAGGYEVELWDISKQEKIDTLPHEGRVRCLTYSPNGRLLATGSMQKGAIRIWELRSREIIKTMFDGGGWVECLAFSPDSKLLVSEGWGDLGFHVWDVESGQRIATLPGHIEPVGDNHSVLFSPDGKLLATAGYDSKVILWNTRTWEPVRTLLGHSAILMDLSFSPDGRRLASSGIDSLCKVWDVASGQEVASFPGFTVDFSPKGNTLAVGGYYHLPAHEGPPEQSKVRLYRAPTLEEIERELADFRGERRD